MNILYLAQRIPYPPRKGDKLRSFHQVEYLARRHKVWCGCFVDSPSDDRSIEPLRAYCHDVAAIRLNRMRAMVWGLAGVVRGGTVTESFYAHPVMQAHAQKLGETFFLVTAQAGDLVVADKVDGRGFLRASPPVGSSVPVHATAVGKVFLAYAPDLVHTPAGRLRAYTSTTARTPAALRRSITTTQRAGYAISRDEWVEGLTAVAAPIRASERLVGAIAAALVSQRLGELGLDRVVQSVSSAAAAINLKLAGG